MSTDPAGRGLAHDRPKDTPIPADQPHPFLRKIGFQTADGRIKASMQARHGHGQGWALSPRARGVVVVVFGRLLFWLGYTTMRDEGVSLLVGILLVGGVPVSSWAGRQGASASARGPGLWGGG